MIAPGAIEEFDRLLASGAFAGATRQALDLQRLQPRGALPLLLQVDVDLCQGRNDAARRLLAKALGSDIDGPHTALRLMQVLDRLSESGLMIEVAGQLPPPMWGSATQLAQAAHVLTGVGAFALARQYAHAAVAKDGRNPPALYALATLETFYGDLAGAAELCTRCLAILPDDAGAFWLLSRLRQPGGGVRIDRLRSLLAASTSVEDRVWYGYALHNELHELGDHEASWAALAEACATKRALLGDGIGRYGDLLDALLAAEDWPQPAAATPIAAAPVASLRAVFVIGLHRSGTTLAEQVLAGHPSVAGGGETYDIRAQLRRVTRLHYPHELDTRVIAQRHAIDFPALGRHYLRGMSWRAEGKPVVTDKLPLQLPQPRPDRERAAGRQVHPPATRPGGCRFFEPAHAVLARLPLFLRSARFRTASSPIPAADGALAPTLPRPDPRCGLRRPRVRPGRDRDTHGALCGPRFHADDGRSRAAHERSGYGL